MNDTSLAIELPPQAREIADVIRQNSKFLVTGHIRPDGDCLGSCLALVQVLHQLGKSAVMFTAGPVPNIFSYLEGFSTILTTLPPEADYDAVLCVDTADAGRVFTGYEPAPNLYVIDHHISNTMFGKVNWVDGKSAAAAEMIYWLARELNATVTPEIATALFTGIATDTGSFRFTNTTETTFRIAANLVGQGAKIATVSEAAWGSRSATAVKLTAMVLSTINYEFDGRLAWNEVTREVLSAANADSEDIEGLSGEMRAIEGVEVSVLFSETPEGECRIGFRSKGNVNVSALAQLLGGGGHKAASGATIATPYASAKVRALVVIREFLSQAL